MSFTIKEQERITIVTALLQGKMTNAQAATTLRLSLRQIKRLKKKVREKGREVLIHQLKGRISNHHFDEVTKIKTLNLVKEKYSDFKPKFASEKLAEANGLIIHSQTLRRWMSDEGLWKIHKQKNTKYHAFRERKEYFGELQQFDGSYHLWFEERLVDEYENPKEVCLLASIDDATGKITHALFDFNEGVVTVFNFWQDYVKSLGKPLGIYLDKFSTYKVNHKAAVDNSDLLTQFQRAMQALGIQLITAHSPEAKGRIERLFQTLQDRLVKEMRLANINTPTQATIFLENVFLPAFNNKFAVVPAKEGDLHKPLSKTDKNNLVSIFSIQSTRKINNDFTIQFKNNWYQLAEIQPATVRPREVVIVGERLDESIHFSLQNSYLNYTVLLERPKKVNKQPVILTSHKLNWKPPAHHPWRQYQRIKS